jgi:hypothetical protein
MAARAALYEELLQLPRHITGEIINERLYKLPSLPGVAAHAKSALLSSIAPTYDRHFVKSGARWSLIFGMQTEVGDDVFVPHAAGWREERLPVIPASYLHVSPDWACEMLTVDNERYVKHVKMPAYHAHGVANVWLVNVLQRTVETYALDNGRWVLLATYGGDDKFRAEPFTAVEIDLGVIWGPTPSEDSSRS